MYPEDNSGALFQLRQELKAMRLMIVLMVCFVLLGLLLGNLYAVFQISKMERIFEEMLGDKNKLPMLTRWVIFYGRLGGTLLPFALTAIVPVSTCGIYMVFRKTRWAQVFAALVVLFLISHWVVITLAMQIPLLQIVQGINSAP
jgi:hypothetical protein